MNSLWVTHGPFLILLSESLSTSVRRLAATSEVGDQPWKFYFKLYCFLDTDNVPEDSVEFAFMFEQVHGALRLLCRRAGVKPVRTPRTLTASSWKSHVAVEFPAWTGSAALSFICRRKLLHVLYELLGQELF